MKITPQTTITVNGVKLTSTAIRRAPQSEANGGHNIAITKNGEVHWMDYDGEVKIFNAGSVRRNQSFGSVLAFLA